MDPPIFETAPLSGRPLNLTDSFAYLGAVKAHFQDQPDVYNRFLEIMGQFSAGR